MYPRPLPCKTNDKIPKVAETGPTVVLTKGGVSVKGKGGDYSKNCGNNSCSGKRFLQRGGEGLHTMQGFALYEQTLQF